MGTALCQRCRYMFSNEGLPELLGWRGSGFRHSPMSSFSERPDCPLCSHMWNENLMSDRYTEDGTYPLMGLRELPSRVKVDLTKATVIFLIRNIEIPELRMYAEFCFSVEARPGRVWRPSRGFSLAASEGDPFAQFTDLRPIRWEGLTEDFAAAAKALLAECEHSHDACKPSGPVPLPTRVLRIIPQESSSPRIQLFTPPPDGPLGRYACLSYCWGGEQKIKLTKTNLHTLQTNGLDANTLPLTLKDAIMATQCLGLQYLWIDALCIIQDDDEDKKREISRMGSIYSSCTICISAATGKSVHDGFLKPARQINTLHPMCKITLPPGHNDKFHGTILLTPIHVQDTEGFAINKRGWTYQEALLSPRTLMFGDLEPILRCRTEDAQQIHKSLVVNYSDPVKPLIITRNVPGYHGHVPLNTASALWPDVVAEYSARRLTKDEDKPIAIQGVIDLFADHMKEKCHFGIWPSYSPGLLWSVAPDDPLGEDVLEGSIEARIRFEADGGSPPTHNRLRITCRVLTAAEVKRANAFVTFDPDIPFDYEAESTVDYLARHEVRDKIRETLDKENAGSSVHGIRCEFIAHLYKMVQESKQGLYVLLICKSKRKHKNLLGILVERVGGNVYTRVGVVELLTLKRWWRCRSKVIVV
ncbi:hypothetical protein RB595_004450 [Gaeumannomyces hyphopodioides]